MIRVLLADDQALVRSGFRVLLEAAGDIQVLGEAADGEQAIALSRQLRPDVVLMDIQMPGTDGLNATRQITGDPTLAGIRILILTTFDEDAHVFEALRSGASGFLVKDAETSQLLHAVRVIAQGEALLAPAVTRRLIQIFASGPRPGATAPAALAMLTDRERQVLSLVAAGLSNEEIAARLVLSPATARTHVSRIMTKVAARDRAQLVVLAYESGLVQPGNP
ncbi:MAG TPA: response regulator transcription factor [Streptosporangiaceae bacterium]|nr:response regulator transcription factor [Streptosporangiaceae bacterium]